MEKPMILVVHHPKDNNKKGQLVDFLDILKKKKLVDKVWDIYENAGADIEEEIKSATKRANLALLIVTVNFLHLEWPIKEICANLKSRQNEIIIYAIIAGHCNWRMDDWLTKLRIRPGDLIPVWVGREDEIEQKLTVIVNELEDVINLDYPALAANKEKSAFELKNVEITIRGDPSKLTFEDKLNCIDFLANYLNYPRETVTLIKIREKENVLEVSMPAEMADLLAKLFEAGNNIILAKLEAVRLSLEPSNGVRVGMILPHNEQNLVSHLVEVLGVPRGLIKIHRGYPIKDKFAFDLSLPQEGIQRLQNLIQVNDGRLGILKIEKIFVERILEKSGEAPAKEPRPKDNEQGDPDNSIRDDPSGPLAPGDFPIPDMVLSTESLFKIKLDNANRIAIVNKDRIRLNHKEFELLRILRKNQGRIIAVDQLVDQIPEAKEAEDPKKFVQGVVSNLRRKIEPDPANPIYIITILTYGYALVRPERTGKWPTRNK